MKTIRKLLLLISIILFLLIISLTIATAFFDYYIVIGGYGTSQILTILAGLDIMLVSLFLLSGNKTKSVITVVSVSFLILTEVMLLIMTFTPKYAYTLHPSSDEYCSVMVEEKTTHDKISVTFSKKTSAIFYKHIYGVSFSDSKKDSYKYGDYTISVDEKYVRINIPSNNKTQILIPH